MIYFMLYNASQKLFCFDCFLFPMLILKRHFDLNKPIDHPFA